MSDEAKGKPLDEMFHGYIASSIDEKGIGFNKAVGKHEDGQVTVMALDLQGQQVIDLMKREAASGKYVELIFGMDCFTRPGQGTTLKDVVVCGWWQRATGGWRIGIIEYQNEPRIVKPWCWDNEHWVTTLRREFPEAA